MTNQSVAKQSLVSKLAEACNAVGGVEKKGRNEHQKYAYVKAADVAKAIRHELFKRGVILETNEKKLKKTTVQTISGTTMRYVTLTVEYTLRDDSGALGPFSAFATAMDSGDKAIWKAKTGALKYFLRGLGIIPDELDDPEADESVDENTGGNTFVKQFDAKTKGQRKITDTQVRILNAAFSNHGKTPAMVAAFLEAKYHVPAVTDLMFDEFNDVIGWANGSEESLVQSLETSKKAVEIRKSKKGPQPIVAIAEQPREDEIYSGD